MNTQLVFPVPSVLFVAVIAAPEPPPLASESVAVVYVAVPVPPILNSALVTTHPLPEVPVMSTFPDVVMRPGETAAAVSVVPAAWE